jgi:hypothetical protein
LEQSFVGPYPRVADHEKTSVPGNVEL